MAARYSALANWTRDELDAGRKWVDTWKRAGKELERIKREELRELDAYRTIAMLCARSGGSLTATFPPRTESGLVEQQRWFMRARRS
ncbi:MAG: hypothetical protein ACT4P6_08625 [Gemmatimonadaceae bacterium]